MTSDSDIEIPDTYDNVCFLSLHSSFIHTSAGARARARARTHTHTHTHTHTEQTGWQYMLANNRMSWQVTIKKTTKSTRAQNNDVSLFGKTNHLHDNKHVHKLSVGNAKKVLGIS